MKFKILLLVGLMCIGLKSQAQEEFRFGITANPGVVWVKPDNQNISSNGVRFGFDFDWWLIISLVSKIDIPLILV
ncbi:MAG: hypothetical protein R2728_07490 [Chitinophagales bacterium]